MKTAHYPGLTFAPPAARPTIFRVLRAGPVALCLVLAGCGGSKESVRPSPAPMSQPWPKVASDNPAAANAVLMRALGLVGTPYRYGGNTPESGFDCSGLVTYVFADMLDVRLPRTSRELAQAQGARIEPSRLAPGDLVFFGNQGNVTHVGIYVGEGRFVHAPSTGGTVRLDHLDGSYWRDHYTGARRVLTRS